MMKPFVPRAPIVMASIIGTFAGTAVLVTLSFLLPRDASGAALLDVPLLLMMTGLLVPISAFGILIFGYPAASAVGEAWAKPWVGVAALLMGALAGFMTRVTLTSVVAGGFARGESFSLMPIDAGAVYGACVGLAYWIFERDWRLRDAARRAAEGPGEEIPSSEEFARLP
ncbi:hypothetical protein WJS89_04945 [Sphingomicrobium sp. XHP0235]|uniref:hypothetical protein n=1 Tax=Sphingomicrobium aquimarinum TaxID=3133971 RepID=UPI0031FF2DAE